MTRKRKKDNKSPGCDQNKDPKRIMADKTSTPAPLPVPGAVNTSQLGQSFVLPPMPPMYHTGSPYFMGQTSPIPIPQSQTLNNDLLQGIMQRLDSMDSKLGQLNSIKSSVAKITERLDKMEEKINTIERSQNFLGEKYDSVIVCSKENSDHISRLQAEVVALSEENTRLQKDYQTCKESVTDLRCRSMKDNLLFFGIPEGPPTSISLDNAGVFSTIEGQMDETASGTNPGNQADGDNPVPLSYASTAARSHQENCSEKVVSFCENVLKISDAKSKIHIVNSHRIGSVEPGKTRPIVARLNPDSKFLIKNALKQVNLRGTNFNVAEQYPPEVKEKRRELIPVMLEARKRGQRAVLVRDKLYINKVLYQATNPK